MKTFKTEIEWVMMPELPIRKSEPFKIQFGILSRIGVVVFCEARSGIDGIYDHYMREAVYDFEKEEFIDKDDDTVFDDVAAWAYYDKVFDGVREAYLDTMK